MSRTVVSSRDAFRTALEDQAGRPGYGGICPHPGPDRRRGDRHHDGDGQHGPEQLLEHHRVLRYERIDATADLLPPGALQLRRGRLTRRVVSPGTARTTPPGPVTTPCPTRRCSSGAPAIRRCCTRPPCWKSTAATGPGGAGQLCGAPREATF